MFVTCVIFCLFLTCESARILGVFPMPFVAHQVVFREYTQELARRGHELVILTPMPAFHSGASPSNTSIMTIDTQVSIDRLNKVIDLKFKKGVVCDADCVLNSHKFNNIKMKRLFAEQINSPEVQKIIQNNSKFDLIIVEDYVDSGLNFSKTFNAPVIQMSSFYILPHNLENIGSSSRHPLIHPVFYRLKFDDLSFLETLIELRFEYYIMRYYLDTNKLENDYIKAINGKDSETIEHLKENIIMILGNCHRIFDNNRAVSVNVIYLGALHLKPVKKIPQNLKKFLDNSARSVVYVSFGTNVLLSAMDKDFLRIFLDAFKMLPYDILLKSDIDDLDVSENVKMDRWFPQRDLLMHPNVKAFLTQGGLQSTDEAIDAGVPLVGMRIWADQGFNIHKYIEFGIGVKLDPMTITADDVVAAVNTVIKNVRENIQLLKSWIQDQPRSAKERAVWWTEYVLRHGGARHLRSPAANMSCSEYYEIELLFILGLLFKSFILIVLYTIYRVQKRLKSML